MAGDKLLILCGPTAAGKSALAQRLAERHGLSIVSADSRQVYRGFDIGTAKPSRAERSRVRHYGIDVCEPTERYSAAAFARAASSWLVEESAAGRRVLVVGGTGFYVRALVQPLSDSPPLDPGRRETLAAHLAALSLTELRRWCGSLDPALAHLGKAQLIRAVETSLLAGRRLSDFHAASADSASRPASYLIVDPGPPLTARIEARVDEMLAAGWLEEVRGLDRRLPGTAPAWSATGYHFLRAAVRGELELADAREKTIVASRQYAKRQRTWFRNQLSAADSTRLDPTAADADRMTEDWLEANR